VALSWKHDSMMPELLEIFDSNNRSLGWGIVVAFSDEILWDSAHHPHVFHLLLRNDLLLDRTSGPFDCRCMYPTPMVAVDVTLDASGKLVTAAVAQAAPDAAPPGGSTKALALLLDDKAIRRLRTGTRGDLFVKLRGDFVIDRRNKRAVDAEFVRAELPRATGHQGAVRHQVGRSRAGSRWQGDAWARRSIT
jgi:hypothetical protein